MRILVVEMMWFVGVMVLLLFAGIGIGIGILDLSIWYGGLLVSFLSGNR